MVNKQVKNRSICLVCALLLLVTIFAGGRSILTAFADTQYTNAMTDLATDSGFNAADYPDDANDYSIQVIQIAESANGELFVYTYQPSQKTTYLVATEINMSLSESVDGTKLYGLTLINCEGVFGKYKVNELSVQAAETRYYNITSIYREWIKGIDEETGNDNVKNSVAFNVGKLFKATTENGVVKYACKATEVVEIINPYADFLLYSNGYHLNYDACRSHYVAFSTDKQIDTLQEATVTYDWQEFSQSGLGGWQNSEIHHETKTVKGNEKGGNSADGWFAAKYEWERIQSVEAFIKSEELNDETEKNLEGKQWVLRFVDTEYIVNVNGGAFGKNKYTDVTNVSVLRLKFVTAGKVYDLGAVSDKITGDNKPGNTNDRESIWEWLERMTGVPQWVWKLIFSLIVISIALPVLSLIFPVVGQVLKTILGGLLTVVKWLFIGLWWLVCLPFKGIAALVRKIRNGKDGGEK